MGKIEDDTNMANTLCSDKLVVAIVQLKKGTLVW